MESEKNSKVEYWVKLNIEGKIPLGFIIQPSSLDIGVVIANAKKTTLSLLRLPLTKKGPLYDPNKTINFNRL
ncbi:MAG: hypothetical protein BA873_14120 [Desulfobulbaceae bacterium C00003063]|nr:MAG: hypothetical protein BA873_14120 [Desulfobulbaceae bacterium C00003063]